MRVPPAGPEQGPLSASLFQRPRPRVVIKADLLPALSVLSLVALVGVPVAWLWSRLAPPRQNAVTSGGDTVPVLVESSHQFDGLAVFVLLTAAAGVLTGAVLWRVRRRRGPVVLVAATAGSTVAAWLAAQLGPSFAAGRYPIPPRPQPGDLLTLPPEMTTIWAVLLQPLMVALVYGLASSWNGLEDLGRRREGALG